MHKMHDRSKRNTLTTTPDTKHVHQPGRTGPSLNEEQQDRIALRAAKAMEKQIKRRHDRRFLFIWGDRKKASIKWFPGGTFEISVPQTLTPEQEHFEFPPRSRLLKKLATAAAEQKRGMQDDANDHYKHVKGQHHQNSNASAGMPMSTRVAQCSPPTLIPAIKSHDHDAIAEWFRQKTSADAKSRTTQIIKRKKKTSSLTSSSAERTKAASPAQPNQLQNTSAKRKACSVSSQLVPPPDDSVHKHYVPLSLLRHKNNTLNRKLPKQQQGLIKLVDVFHQKLHEQQRLAHHSQQQLHVPPPPNGLDLRTQGIARNKKSYDTGCVSSSTVNMRAMPASFYATRELARPAVKRSNKINYTTRAHPNSCKKESSPCLPQQHPIRPSRSIQTYTR
ncbi:hypothetical protein BX666DRAFT_1904350 [Dichotomocladium elegans]|nr:hypothetical protein BX666DRAFT_1904350 [Dichotomocladium elegans]